MASPEQALLCRIDLTNRWPLRLQALQRTILEKKIVSQLTHFKGCVLVVRGVLSNKNTVVETKKLKIVDYLLSKELENAMNQSNVVLGRSGYSTVMDLAVLGKKAFFIPTPGQLEQEYLAKSLNEKKITPFCTQQNFSIDKLNDIKNYSGFKSRKTTIDLKLFELFDSK